MSSRVQQKQRIQGATLSHSAAGCKLAGRQSWTYVLARPAVPTQRTDTAEIDWPLWQQSLHQADEIPYEVREARPVHGRPHPQPIAFTGVGDPREFPVNAFARTMQDVLRRDGTALPPTPRRHADRHPAPPTDGPR